MRPIRNDELSLARHGAVLLPDAATELLPALFDALRNLTPHRAGIRLFGNKALADLLLPDGPVGALAGAFAAGPCRPVRALLFDKSQEMNWSLAWHQDRTICVAARVEAEGYGPWTVKAGLLHVAPPFTLLSRMLTMRVHLDDVPASNAPLLIAPGSHAEGRIPVAKIDATVARCGSFACLANAGDVWLYATPILHASERASLPTRRRVLQIDYSPDQLPDGMQWLGI